MRTDDYDLIVIGAGMAGVSAANKCASKGWKVAVVDTLPYGRTCALRGSDPEKILRRGSEIIDSARLTRGKGIDDADLSITLADLIKHKNGFTDPVPPLHEGRPCRQRRRPAARVGPIHPTPTPSKSTAPPTTQHTS